MWHGLLLVASAYGMHATNAAELRESGLVVSVGTTTKTNWSARTPVMHDTITVVAASDREATQSHLLSLHRLALLSS